MTLAQLKEQGITENDLDRARWYVDHGTQQYRDFLRNDTWNLSGFTGAACPAAGWPQRVRLAVTTRYRSSERATRGFFAFIEYYHSSTLVWTAP
jgi:hypothetical protein